MDEQSGPDSLPQDWGWLSDAHANVVRIAECLSRLYELAHAEDGDLPYEGAPEAMVALGDLWDMLRTNEPVALPDESDSDLFAKASRNEGIECTDTRRNALHGP